MSTACTASPAPVLLAVCALTHVTALAATVVGQAGTSSVVAANHASIVVDDSVQVIAGQLLLLLTNAELAQVQVPVVPVRELGRQSVGAQGAHPGPNALPIVARVHCSPNRKFHQVVDLVTPDEAAEGEALELHNENIGQAPQQQLLGGLTVLLALRAVPAKRWGVEGSRPAHLPSTLPQHPICCPALTRPPQVPAPQVW